MRARRGGRFRDETARLSASDVQSIAAQYGVDIFKLIKVNSIADPDNLRVGQELKIPDD